MKRITTVTFLMSIASPLAFAQFTDVDHVLEARPKNVSWGWIPTDKEPVLTIDSGETVRIDTISHHGSTQDQDPVEFLGDFGIQSDEILDDVINFWASRPDRPREGRTGAHVLTGPIEITDAEPGDTLEIQVLEVSTRVPYGFNSANATTGVLSEQYPGAREGDFGADISDPTRTLIRTTIANGREYAMLGDLRIPLDPFMGIMAVAPRDPAVGQPGVTVAGIQSSRPPGAYGGNMDIRQLTAGSTLYLPVFRDGAHFYTGDPHAVQGDGEVSGTALEHSLTGIFRFVLHKGRAPTAPLVETPTHYLAVGIDLDLDRAMRKAVAETIVFLSEEKGLTSKQAFTLSSLAVDFSVAEAVNLTQVVTASIPKSLFDD